MCLVQHPVVYVTVIHAMFLGTLTKLQRATISFVMSVHASVRVE